MCFWFDEKDARISVTVWIFVFDDDVYMVGIAGGKQEERNAHNLAGASMPLIK